MLPLEDRIYFFGGSGVSDKFSGNYTGEPEAMISLLYVEAKLNILRCVFITQLFFLGSTLIFIGFDLLYEWIVEVRHKVGYSVCFR